MAKTVTNKREREKLKEQKRKEKQKRKEERQKSGTSSFEDMIVYVDEHGQFHSTPPEMSNKEVDVDDIVISIPKQEEVEKAPLNGRVEHFNASKGYGFIKDLDSAEKYFFHITSAPASIAEGDKVTFETEQGSRGLTAVQIIIVKK